MHLTNIPHAQRSSDYYTSEPTPVPILQRQFEWQTILDIYANRKPQRVLELGTFHGGTLYHWLRLAQPGTTVVSIDTYTTDVDNRKIYQTWTPPTVKLHVICGDTRNQDVIEQAKEQAPYDWIFIDAGHYEPEVTADWNNYKPLVATNGIIAFHDILDHPEVPDIEVGRLWRKIQRLGYITQEICSDPDARWGAIGIVYMADK